MNLLVDIGNSRLKWACLVGGEFNSSGSVARPRAQIEDLLSQCWSWSDPPIRVLVANVAGPAIGKAMNRWVRDKWGVGVEFIEAPVTGWGVRNAYLNPYRLGADRWAALVAARQLTKEHVYLVDAGTALTIDVMGADGTHQGGLIVPGLGLMRQVLVDRAAGIRLERAADSASATSLLARDTSGAVNGGTLYGAVAFVDRVRQDVESELGAALRCIITGGDAEKLLPLLSGNFEYHEHLVLRGLAVIATERA